MDKNGIPPKELINLALEVGGLKKVIRTGWKKKGVKHPESVADHTWRVAILALVLAPKLKVDPEKIVKMALIHDLGEVLAGDIIWEKGKKVIGSQEDKHKKERTGIKKMFSDNPSFTEYVLLWEEFILQVSKEAKVIKLLDKLEMLIQAYEYERNGENKESLQEFWDNVEKYLKDTELEPYLNELKSIRAVI